MRTKWYSHKISTSYKHEDWVEKKKETYSLFKISPFSKGLISGMPWQITSLTDLWFNKFHSSLICYTLHYELLQKISPSTTEAILGNLSTPLALQPPLYQSLRNPGVLSRFKNPWMQRSTHCINKTGWFFLARSLMWELKQNWMQGWQYDKGLNTFIWGLK